MATTSSHGKSAPREKTAEANRTTPSNGSDLPKGELAIRTLAMPADTNPSGDVFGGWLLAQMDIAGGIAADAHAGGRVATVAIQAMKFHRPVNVGDVVCCYSDIGRMGRTSVTVMIEVWVLRRGVANERIKVTEGVFTYVAIDPDGNPRVIGAAAAQ